MDGHKTIFSRTALKPFVAVLIALLLLWLLLSRLPGGPVTGRASGTASAAVDAFFDSGQALGGNVVSYDVVLGDVDGDGDLDAFVASYDAASKLWINKGGAQGGTAGKFEDSGQALGAGSAVDVDLADLDGDGDLDAFQVIDASSNSNQVWINQGAAQGGTAGVFQGSGQAFGDDLNSSVALADLDGDNDVDALVGRNIGRPSKVWLNDGNGNFSDSGQSLDADSVDVALGDVDGDGDPDAFSANGSDNKVWINQGGLQGGTPGVFLDSGQTPGSGLSLAVSLGDLDGDGDLDAFVANSTEDSVWINQGGMQSGTEGAFVDSGQSLSADQSRDVALGDLDGDGDLDAFLAKQSGNEVWVNQGEAQGGTEGIFLDSGQSLGDSLSEGVDLGDVDGDGDPDAFVANWALPDKVWLNGPQGLPTATFDVIRETNDEGQEVTYQATGGDALLPVLLSHTVTETIHVHAGINSGTATMTETLPFAPGVQVQYLNLINPNPDPQETITLTLSVTPSGVNPGPDDVSDRLLFVFVDGEQGLKECFLCYVAWLAYFTGFSPEFGTMHHMDLSAQQDSAQWSYYTGLFDLYSPELTNIMASNPALLWQALETLDAVTPAVEALSEGSGATYVLSQGQMDGLEALFEGIEGEAGPGLQAAINREQAALDIPSFAGMDMETAWKELIARRPVSELYMSVIVK